jgi:hypothetical protein
MLRARILSAREAGREESIDALMEQGLQMGLDLAGFSLSGEVLRQMNTLVPGKKVGIAALEHELIGGGPLWLRAEPDEDPEQADALAAVVAVGIGA